MTLTPRWLLPASLLLVSSVASAVDYTEEEPNDAFPPAYLTGNPIFNPGDRLLGSVDGSASDIDSQYLRFAGTGAPGIYRYTFTLATNNAAADTALDLYDTSASGFYIARSDDTSTSVSAPALRFDHLDLTGGTTAFGLDVYSFDDEVFNYNVTFSRQAVTPTALGSLNGAFSGTVVDTGAAGNWYTFTVGEGALSLATTGALDTEFVIYNSTGVAVAASDDTGTNPNASVTGVNLAAGTYYLSLGQYNVLYDYNLTTGVPVGWNVAGVGHGTTQAAQGTFGFNGTFTPSAVPEPASMAALGFGALALLRRRARKS